MSKLCYSVLAGLLPLLVIPAHAATQFTFTGQVTDDAINGCGVLVACGAVTGSYTFDPLAPDGNPSPTAGLYATTSITFSINAALFFSSAGGFINVGNFPAVDQYGLLATGTATNLSAADLSILLSDPTAAAFSSDALPLSPSALATLLPGSFQLNAADDSFQLLGTIDSVSVVTASPVPEPSLGALLALGLLMLFVGRHVRLAIFARPVYRVSAAFTSDALPQNAGRLTNTLPGDCGGLNPARSTGVCPRS